jgi:hypothetical protein
MVLDEDPISYAMKYNQAEVSNRLIDHCTKNNIFKQLHYDCGGLIMRDLLINFFEESEETSLPLYGDVSFGVIPVLSHSPMGYEIRPAELPIAL